MATTNREAITYAPTLDVLQRLAGNYVGKAVTLSCSGCGEEVYCGLYQYGPAAREEKRDRIVALFQHTAFEHAVRHDVVKVVSTTELVWEPESRTEPFPVGLGGMRKAGA